MISLVEKLKRWLRPEREAQAPPDDSAARTVEASGVAIDTLTPTEFRALLTAAEGGDIASQAELFEKMQDRDTLLDSHLRTRRLAVRGCGYEIQPGDDSARADEIATEARRMLGRIPNLGDAMDAALDAIGQGFGVNEIEWDTSERQWSIGALTYRPQRWFQVGADGQELRLRDGTDEGAELNPLNFWIFRYQARNGYLARTPLLRSCTRPFIIRAYGWRDWLRFAEVFGMPMRVGILSQDVEFDSREAREFYAAIRAIGHDYAAVIREGNRIEFPTATAMSARRIARWTRS